MTIVLFLDGVPHPIDGRAYPAGVGLPRNGDQLVIGSTTYRVRSVQWFLWPGSERALERIEIRATRIGA